MPHGGPVRARRLRNPCAAGAGAELARGAQGIGGVLEGGGGAAGVGLVAGITIVFGRLGQTGEHGLGRAGRQGRVRGDIEVVGNGGQRPLFERRDRGELDIAVDDQGVRGFQQLEPGERGE